jgi:hypothetical protein
MRDDDSIEANDGSAAALLQAQRDRRNDIAARLREGASRSKAAERVRRQRAEARVKAQQTEDFERKVAEVLAETNDTDRED